MSSSDQGRVLYQFPISHFCEKTRWNLDAKGLTYRTKDLVPGLHVVALSRFGRRTSVPLLVDGETVIGDSAAIAAHLDRAYPDRPLLPTAREERARARELETWFGKTAGRSVRVWAYGQFGATPGGMVRRLFADYPPGTQRVATLVAPVFERLMRRRYGIDAAGIAKARAALDECFDRIEKETGGDPTRYLVGDRLTIADISAAALLGPLVAPPGSPWLRDRSPHAPAGIVALRAQLGSRPAWRWVEARYDKDRSRVRSSS